MTARTLRCFGASLGALLVLCSAHACVGDDPALDPDVGGVGGDASQSDVGSGADALDEDATLDGATETDASDCGDTSTSEENCGACGHRCKAGVGCHAGRCGDEVVGLAVGLSSSCAVVAGGHVYCWGQNDDHQVGDPSGVNRNAPYHVDKDVHGNEFGSVVQVSVGERHACARKADGSIWCWGNDAAKQIAGQTSAQRPNLIEGTSGYKQIAAGGYFNCGIDGSNVVKCWGGNAYGALGHEPGNDSDMMVACTVPEGTHCNTTPRAVGVEGISGSLVAESIALGRAHGCAISQDGFRKVLCWGLNDEAQLATDPDAGLERSTAKEVPGVTGATAVYAGGRGSSCALVGGALKCWGANMDGQLGIGSNDSPVITPTSFGGLTGVTAGVATPIALCAATDRLYCAGFTMPGTVGHGSFFDDTGVGGAQWTPAAVRGADGGAFSNITHLAGGLGLHVCARLSDNTVWCWGDNTYGQLGNGESGPQEKRNAPVQVSLP